MYVSLVCLGCEVAAGKGEGKGEVDRRKKERGTWIGDKKNEGRGQETAQRPGRRYSEAEIPLVNSPPVLRGVREREVGRGRSRGWKRAVNRIRPRMRSCQVQVSDQGGPQLSESR